MGVPSKCGIHKTGSVEVRDGRTNDRDSRVTNQRNYCT